MDVTAALLATAVTVGALAPSSPEVPLTEAAEVRPIVSIAAESRQSQSTWGQTPTQWTPQLSAERPAALVPLYASLAALQGMDIYTTVSALSRGGVEANPAMRPVAGNAWTATAVKTGATAASIYFIERAWKHNRKGAVILATAINVATAAVVAHNTRVAR